MRQLIHPSIYYSIHLPPPSKQLRRFQLQCVIKVFIRIITSQRNMRASSNRIWVCIIIKTNVSLLYHLPPSLMPDCGAKNRDSKCIPSLSLFALTQTPRKVANWVLIISKLGCNVSTERDNSTKRSVPLCPMKRISSRFVSKHRKNFSSLLLLSFSSKSTINTSGKIKLIIPLGSNRAINTPLSVLK